MYHSTIHWLSLDNAIIKIIIKSLKIPRLDVKLHYLKLRDRADGLIEAGVLLRRVSVVGMVRSLAYQDCERNIS